MKKGDTVINLEFQDFGHSSSDFLQDDHTRTEPTDYSASFNDFEDDDQGQRLLGGDDISDSSRQQQSKLSFWTLEFYQQFFNVDSKQVGDRIMWSVIPKPGVNYLDSYIRPNPDLYGPFWICTTLVMTTAIAGNISSYFQTPETYKWRYDFHKVTLATSFVFTYAWLLPVLLFGVFYWRASKIKITLLELICLYGYSLSIFVPISLMWMIPIRWMQWCLGIVASVLSGSVLVLTIRPAISVHSKKVALALSAAILVLHAMLSLGFMLYFFYPAGSSSTLASAHNLSSSTNSNIVAVSNSSKEILGQNVKKVIREKPAIVQKGILAGNERGEVGGEPPDQKQPIDGKLSKGFDQDEVKSGNNDEKNSKLQALSLVRSENSDKIRETSVKHSPKPQEEKSSINLNGAPIPPIPPVKEKSSDNHTSKSSGQTSATVKSSSKTVGSTAKPSISTQRKSIDTSKHE